MKKTIYLLNVSEDEINIEKSNNKNYIKFKNYIKDSKEDFVVMSAQIEYEISKLPDDEQKMFLEELGLKESGINLVATKAFKTLGLSTYFTAGVQEIHAWAFKDGITAPEAAGIIHTDFEKGFIKAEVYSYESMEENKSEQALKEKGLIRLEGKDYIVKDGDVCHFRFNV